jgi:Cu+-exporting ATPase
MGKVIDPICGMTVDPETAAGKYEYEGTTYYFCGIGCLNKFKGDPASFVNPKEKAVDLAKDVEYTCPMHPQISQMGPGSCPICGMALEPRVVSLDTVEDNTELQSMSRRFWISVALSIPVFLLASAGMVFSIERFVPPNISSWIQFALGSIVVLWGGLPFFQRALASVKNVSPNMFTLIAMGTGAAWGSAPSLYFSRRVFLPPSEDTQVRYRFILRPLRSLRRWFC